MQYIVSPHVRVKVNNVQPKLTPFAKASLIARGKGESGLHVGLHEGLQCIAYLAQLAYACLRLIIPAENPLFRTV